MMILERLVHGGIEVSVFDLVSPQPGHCGGDLGEFPTKVFALLVRALGCCREGGEFCVDLMEEFAQFAEVEGAGVVDVVLLEQLVEAAEVAAGLWEALSDAVGDLCPFSECEFDLFGVSAFLPFQGAHEGDDVVGQVVLDGRAITNGVYISQGCSDETQMRICLECPLVVLGVQLVGESLAKFCSGCRKECVSYS